MIREYRNYFQAIDRKTNIPIMGEYDGECHALDAVRYKICSLIPIKQSQEIRRALGQRQWETSYGNKEVNPAV